MAAQAPMTEATYYILLALMKPGHGYGMMQRIKEFRSCDFETSQVKIASFHFDLELRHQFCFCFHSFLVHSRIHTLRCLVIICFFKPRPSWIDRHKSFEDTTVNHTQFWQIGVGSVLCIIQKALNSYKVISADDCGMVVEIPALRPLSAILLRQMIPIVRGEGLSCKDIPTVPFIAENLNYAS